MSVKSLVKIEGYFYVIFVAKIRQKSEFTSIILPVKSPEKDIVKLVKYILKHYPDSTYILKIKQ